jgi:hypothetical protein
MKGYAVRQGPSVPIAPFLLDEQKSQLQSASQHTAVCNASALENACLLSLRTARRTGRKENSIKYIMSGKELEEVKASQEGKLSTGIRLTKRHARGDQKSPCKPSSLVFSTATTRHINTCV